MASRRCERASGEVKRLHVRMRFAILHAARRGGQARRREARAIEMRRVKNRSKESLQFACVFLGGGIVSGHDATVFLCMVRFCVSFGMPTSVLAVYVLLLTFWHKNLNSRVMIRGRCRAPRISSATRRVKTMSSLRVRIVRR